VLVRGAVGVFEVAGAAGADEAYRDAYIPDPGVVGVAGVLGVLGVFVVAFVFTGVDVLISVRGPIEAPGAEGVMGVFGAYRDPIKDFCGVGVLISARGPVDVAGIEGVAGVFAATFEPKS
jgi:hypothetical protein